MPDSRDTQIFRAFPLFGTCEIARFYLLIVSPILLALNFVFVPFHAPDDYDHVKRAYTLAHGSVWPTAQFGKSSGGYIDAGLSQLVEVKRAIFDWPRVGTISPSSIVDASSPVKNSLRWSSPAHTEFPGDRRAICRSSMCPRQRRCGSAKDLTLASNNRYLALGY